MMMGRLGNELFAPHFAWLTFSSRASFSAEMPGPIWTKSSLDFWQVGTASIPSTGCPGKMSFSSRCNSRGHVWTEISNPLGSSVGSKKVSNLRVRLAFCALATGAAAAAIAEFWSVKELSTWSSFDSEIHRLLVLHIATILAFGTNWAGADSPSSSY